MTGTSLTKGTGNDPMALFQRICMDRNNAAARRDFHAEECHVRGVSAVVNHTLPKRPVRYGRTDKDGEKRE